MTLDILYEANSIIKVVTLVPSIYTDLGRFMIRPV